jgi:putative photosynthetic complex assembly protein
VIAQFEPATNGFLRSTVRGLVRERKRREIGSEMPFRISMEANGRLLLTDPATNRTVDLRAFGPTNLDVFARLLPDRAVAALR